MSTSDVIVIGGGAALLYWLYKKNQPTQLTPAQTVQAAVQSAATVTNTAQLNSLLSAYYDPSVYQSALSNPAELASIQTMLVSQSSDLAGAAFTVSSSSATSATVTAQGKSAAYSYTLTYNGKWLITHIQVT